MKIATIVGARPQFIKAAPVSRRLREVADEVLIHTGQHYDANMSDVFFKDLGMPQPAYNLGVGSGLHGEQTGEMLKRMEPVLLRERPSWIVVYGDTNSTLAGALEGVKLHIPVAHVEAGLRSFNRAMPEEINRVVTDHISSLLFAPTAAAVSNLRREGICVGVHQVGDVMYDAALEHLKTAEERSQILERLHLFAEGYALATVHRAENTDDPRRLGAILDALERITTECPVVFPVHPRTRRALGTLSRFPLRGIVTTEPLSYLDMLRLESSARFIVTDSGGVQKEAFFFRVPCITTRDETEWLETVQSGWNTLTGADTARILSAVKAMRPGTETSHPYGRGDSCGRIVEILTDSFRHQNRYGHSGAVSTQEAAAGVLAY